MYIDTNPIGAKKGNVESIKSPPAPAEGNATHFHPQQSPNSSKIAARPNGQLN
jgi:hypothetical protein